MRKILTAVFALVFLQLSVFANTITITVSNYQFTPSTANAVLGDVIKWEWQQGNGHTTTSTTIPAGATSWDQNISSSQSYSYTVNKVGTYDYVCTPHEGLGMVGQIVVTDALPVSLTSFTVAPAKLNAALLAWVTSKEENTSYFAVKKSNDGRNFSEIGRINAAGNSTLLQQYSYTDNNVGTVDPYVYYFLDIVDKDGKKQSSQIISFKNAGAVSKLIGSITPNPISSGGHLMLQFYADKTGIMNAKVFTSDGKLALENDLSADRGLNGGHLHLGNLKPGVYNVVFTLDGKRETYKIVIQ